MKPILRVENVLFDCPEGVRIAFLSDLHFRKCSLKRVHRIVTVTVGAEPDLIILGGDYIESAGCLPLLRDFASTLTKHAPVFAIAGNHDYRIGVLQIQSALEEAGVRWVEKRTLDISCRNQIIAIHGNHTVCHQESGRIPILCAHNPRLFSQPGATDFVLGFAGHLHGCQAVFWERNGELYPGRWFYKWNGLRYDYENSSFLISRGLGDTLPFRFRCPHEIVLAQLVGQAT
ncbi:MAG: hypothetical protein HOI25_01000 [Proteobacteria bacterium]|nr:hypothetical protein [Pseudomonadota bacterium]